MRDYKQPNLPPRGIPWFMVSPTGFPDGPFYTDAVEQSTLPHRPAVILGGSPRVLRLKRQRGNILELEDGTYKVVLGPNARPVRGWPHLELSV